MGIFSILVYSGKDKPIFFSEEFFLGIKGLRLAPSMQGRD